MKRVLFVCAGSRPLGRIHPEVIQAMLEKGIDISGQRSKGLQSMPDPAGRGIETVRDIRDAIECSVRDLSVELHDGR